MVIARKITVLIILFIFNNAPHLRVSVKAAAAGDFPLSHTRKWRRTLQKFSLGADMTACQAQL